VGGEGNRTAVCTFAMRVRPFLTMTFAPATAVAESDWRTVPLLPNIWLGITVVNQAEVDRDVPKLLRVPAAVRFLSVEPMLGPINLRCIDVDGDHEIHPLTGTTECVDGDGQPAPDLPGISWVICGGESGPKARPMHPDWAYSLMQQCKAAGVAFFMKQMGGTRDKRGALDDLPVDLRVRSFPQ
jgi:protein gp37